MNSKIIKIIIFSLLIIVVYIGFKYYCYLKYKSSDNLELSNVKINGNMTINHTELDEYVTFNNLKFKNVFDGYERFNEESNAYKMVLKNENGENNKAVFIGNDNQYLYIINNNKEYKDLSSIIKKENINDDVDLIKYMEKHNDDKVKFFMTTKKQKQIYFINEFKLLMLPSIEYVKLVDGYYRGYIFKTNKDITDVNIIKDNKKYYFTFIGDYTEEFIHDFMNTIVIE
ncbi:MAG: hypothetical protein IKR57_05400 [Bacilli bacterium]|nr:hypothetical protein [Bacilli bacterium]